MAPSTVVSTADGLGYQRYRRTALKNGRHWAFYTYASTTGWKTSTDGVTWGSEALVPNWAYGGYYKVGSCFETRAGVDYVHLCYFDNVNGGAWYYKRGVLNSDGTITWTATQTIAGSNYKFYPSVCVDTNGNAWVTYRRYDATNVYPVITKNANIDGAWSTASGYPLDLHGAGYDWQVGCCALTAGKVVAWYGISNANTIYAKRYSGSAWGSEETVSTICAQAGDVAGLAVGDDVYLAFVTTGNNIVVHKRTYDTGWGAAVTVYAAGAAVYPAIGYEVVSGRLFVFWTNKPTAGHVYYKASTALTPMWDADPTDWTSGETSLSNTNIIAAENSASYILGVMWIANSVTRYFFFKSSEDIAVSDVGAGADVVALLDCDFVYPTDSGAGVETVTLLDYDSAFVSESGLAAEFVWHTKDLVLINTFEPPHVLSIRIRDEADMDTRLIQGGSLPKQKMLGKPGRVVEIEGWTKDQDDIDSMEALADGTVRTFLHPSGDSFAVLVTDFDPESRVDEYDRRIYRLTLKETR